MMERANLSLKSHLLIRLNEQMRGILHHAQILLAIKNNCKIVVVLKNH